MQQTETLGVTAANKVDRRQKVNAANAAYRAANPEKVREWNERYRRNNPDRFRKSQRDYKRGRYARDPEYRLVMQLRSRLSKAIGRGSSVSAAVAQCGCSLGELIKNIESQFQRGMSWEERSAWHIDHIYPLAAVDPSDRRQVLAANNWRNLRPEWPSVNRRKSDLVTEEAAELFRQILQTIPEMEPDDAAKV